ncbi:MAG: orotidine-5'-phosphate decarboxylase [Bacilli bacterium]
MNREVIIACDFSSRVEFINFVNKFNQPLFLKIGMELFYKEGPEIVEYAKKCGHKVFLDLKLHDIPNTVYKSLLNIKNLNVEFVTVHASGGSAMLKQVSKALEGSNTKALAVTILTSIDDEMLEEELNVKVDLKSQVVNLAKISKKSGIFGVICSPNEVTVIKENVDIACVTPGIRMSKDTADDQKRIATPKDAYEMGSDFIVVGRSITASEDVVSAYNTCAKQFGGSYE